MRIDSMKRIVFILPVAFMFLGSSLAHPHFKKSVSADMKGKAIRLEFTTYPYNEAHLSQVQSGFVFHCGRATLTTTADASCGGQTIPAGRYILRAQAKSIDDWTLVLLPAEETENSYNVDISSGIRLKSSTLTGQPSSHHLALDLNSGHGQTDGMLILSVAYGQRRIEAALGVN
jgi:hypothetical protein